ncbi:MAG: acyl-CoA synthetase, partial [Nocardioides sp.]
SYILATPERQDDADNPLRLAFGNEANEKDIAAFSTRFGCEVRDGFGSTENAVIISRVEGTPSGSLGSRWKG